MPDTSALALVLALIIGISLGALGAGGSIVTFPVLVFVAGISPKPAVGMAMSIVGATSLLGSYLHWRNGNFYWKAALNFGSAGIVGSYTGSTFTHLISSTTLTLLFAGLMFVVGTLLLAGRNSTPRIRHDCSLTRFMATGFAVGCLSGFLGVGGGFLIVPALVWFTGVDTKRAVGTSLAIIAANSASGLLGQLRYTSWSPTVTLEFVVISLVGMIAGVAIASRTPERMLRKVFAVLVLGIATAMVIKVGGS